MYYNVSMRHKSLLAAVVLFGFSSIAFVNSTPSTLQQEISSPTDKFLSSPILQVVVFFPESTNSSNPFENFNFFI